MGKRRENYAHSKKTVYTESKQKVKGAHMILFYFSGTGNSRFVAEAFCRAAGTECYSIEEKLDASALMAAHEIVGFCYPVYGSCVAQPMREFVRAHAETRWCGKTRFHPRFESGIRRPRTRACTVD